MDVPDIEVLWIEEQDPLARRGRAASAISASPAIANAVYNATGKRIRDLPITLDKLM